MVDPEMVLAGPAVDGLLVTEHAIRHVHKARGYLDVAHAAKQECSRKPHEISNRAATEGNGHRALAGAFRHELFAQGLESGPGFRCLTRRDEDELRIGPL